VLPAREKLQELAGADRLDLAPQLVDCVSMNPRQEPALAPGRTAVEPRSQDRAFALQIEQRLRRLAVERDSGVVFEDGAERFQATQENLLRIARTIDRPPTAILADDAFLLSQSAEPSRPIAGLLVGYEAHPEQGLVHFLGRFGLRPGFLAHLRDGGS